jgi:TolB-like protein
MKMLEQLRERRLVQITLSYIGVGWILLQVVDQLVERGLLADIAYQLMLLWFLVGIPAALLIGWNHGEKGRQRAPVSELVVLVFLLATGVGFSGDTVQRHRTQQALAESSRETLRMRSIAVRYFDDGGTGGQFGYLADGLTEALIEELQQVSGLDVVSRNGTAQFRGTDAGADSIARVLDVGTVVEGTVEARGDHVRVHVRVLDGAGNVFKRGTVQRPLDDVVSLNRAVAQETARLLRLWVGAEVRVRESAEGTRSNAGWALLQRAAKLRKDAEARVRAGDVPDAHRLFELADGLLATAERADAVWPDPSTERAEIAYRRARLALATPELAVSLIEGGVASAERALSLNRTYGRALEIRGTLHYLKWLMRVESNVTDQDRLLSIARSDLETAVKYDPTRASAFATLSHLYYRDDVASAVLAATRAYEQDAYLEVADVVLWRLFNGSLELNNLSRARDWCSEGARRFPADYRFVSCNLRLMVTPFVARPDPDSAWLVLDRQDALTPPHLLDLEHIRGELTVGGVIARAGLTDSARAVVDRASPRITPAIDRTNELLLLEAYMRVLTGEKDRAVDLLTRYASIDPQQFERARGEVQWWWRDLESDARFRRLFGLD